MAGYSGGKHPLLVVPVPCWAYNMLALNCAWVAVLVMQLTVVGMRETSVCSRFASTVMQLAGLVPALPVLLQGMQKEASVRPGCGRDSVVQLVFVSAGC